MSENKKTLDELIEECKSRPPMTEEQIEDLVCAIAAAECWMTGDKDCTDKDIRFIRKRDKAGVGFYDAL